MRKMKNNIFMRLKNNDFSGQIMISKLIYMPNAMHAVQCNGIDHENGHTRHATA